MKKIYENTNEWQKDRPNIKKLKREIAGLRQLSIGDNPHAIGEVIKLKVQQLKRIKNGK